MKLIIALLFIYGTYTYGNESQANQTCKDIQTRAAFDIGSGTTKMKVYRFNTCLRTMQAITDKKCEGDIPVAYKEDLKADNTIKTATLNAGVQAIINLKKLAKSCGATQFAAVATSAFRQAKNGSKIANELSEQTQVPVKVISQKEEAMLGYFGAISKLDPIERKNLCIWDIGGSSMQITCSDNLKPYMGKVASVSFKNMLVANKPTPRQRQLTSPNPITLEDYQHGLKVTSQLALEIEKVLGKNLQSLKVYGIGGVHYHSIYKTVGEIAFRSSTLKGHIFKSLGKTDEELGGGPYVTTSLSNIILVQTLMESLEIPDVTAIQVNLTEGLIASPNYWP